MLEMLADRQLLSGRFFRFHRTPRQHRPGDCVFFSALSSWSTSANYASKYGQTGYCIEGRIPGIPIDNVEVVLAVCCLIVEEYDEATNTFLCSFE